eukprot:tig00001094_g7008.t1
MSALVLNIGSSVLHSRPIQGLELILAPTQSLKWALVLLPSQGYPADGIGDDETIRVASGSIEDIGCSARVCFTKYEKRVKGSAQVSKSCHDASEEIGTQDAALKRILELVCNEQTGSLASVDDIAIVAHRVVQGGPQRSPLILRDDADLEPFRALEPLAPLHQKFELDGVELARRALGNVPHVLVFDTMFHTAMPAYASTYAIPRELREGQPPARSFGFHGASYAYVSRKAAEWLDTPLEYLRIVAIHWGNGASAAAIQMGRSVDCSMGMTPNSGLVMGTRSGDVDPGLPGHVARSRRLPLEEAERLLDEHGGLKGLCGTPDMREARRRLPRAPAARRERAGAAQVLRRAAGGDRDARLALDVACYRVKKYVGAYAAAMGGLDALVWTGGVGENAPEVRARSLAGLDFLGIRLDGARNEAAQAGPGARSPPCTPRRAAGPGGGAGAGGGGGAEAGAQVSRVKVLVVPTDEEMEIALLAEGALLERGIHIPRVPLPREL